MPSFVGDLLNKGALAPFGRRYLLDYALATFTRSSEAALADPRLGDAFPLRITKEEHLAYSVDAYNLLPSTEDITWTIENSAVVTTGVEAPDGSATAVTLTDVSALTYDGARTDAVAYPSANDVWVSCFMKRDPAATGWTNFIVEYSGGANAQLGINTQDGTHWSVSGTINAYVALHDFGDYGEWFFVAMRHTGGTGSTVRAWIRPAQGTAGTQANSAAATGSATVWGLRIADATAHGDRAVNPTPWANVNEPRIFGDGSILIEGSRTNEVVYTDLASWTVNGGVVRTLRMGESPANAICHRVQAASGVADMLSAGAGSSARAFSCYVKDDGNGGNYQLGAISPTSYSGGAVPSEWARASWDAGTATGARQMRIGDGRDQSAAGGLTSGARDGLYALPHGENAVFVTSPIRTSGVAVARAAESCSFASASVPAELRTKAQEWVVWPSKASTANTGGTAVIPITVFSYAGGSSSNVRLRLRMETNGTAIAQVVNHAGLATVQATCSWSAGQRLSLTYNPTTGSLTLSGFTTGNGTYSPINAADAFEGDLRIGRYGTAAEPFFGVIGRPRLA